METAWLLQEFGQALQKFRNGEFTERTLSLTSEMATIRLHDSWARFCREVVVSSAADEPFTGKGMRLPKAPGIRCRGDVIPLIIKSMHLRFEPRWATASQTVQAAAILRIVNLPTVSAALGAANSPAEELRHVRNFFAHRAENTASEIKRQHFFFAGMRMEVIDLLAAAVHGGVSRFESWVLGLRVVGVASIQ
ncbi:MAG: hypothetical protein ABSG59_11550 [Verrucomicrobiota bacterium]